MVPGSYGRAMPASVSVLDRRSELLAVDSQPIGVWLLLELYPFGFRIRPRR